MKLHIQGVRQTANEFLRQLAQAIMMMMNGNHSDKIDTDYEKLIVLLLLPGHYDYYHYDDDDNYYYYYCYYSVSYTHLTLPTNREV